MMLYVYIVCIARVVHRMRFHCDCHSFISHFMYILILFKFCSCHAQFAFCREFNVFLILF